MNTHADNCEAPICAADINPNFKKEVVWYPAEAVCSIKAQKFQKNQRRINKLVTNGIFKHMDRYFTAASLERISRVTKSTKGVRA